MEKAKIYLEKALQIRITCYGTENKIEISASYKNLGMLYKDQGNFG